MIAQNSPRYYRFSEIRARFIGDFAVMNIKSSTDGQISGVTSTGCFLRMANGRILFLTGLDRKGPLSIGLPSGAALLREAQTGWGVQVDGDNLVCGTGEWVILAQGAEPWRPVPSDRTNAGPTAEQIARVRTAAQAIYAARPGPGLSYLLGTLAGLPLTTRPVLPLPAKAGLDAARAVAKRQADAVCTQLLPFFGLGSGLTPSGDDFITGLALALNRWELCGWEGSELAALNTSLLSAARQKTTAISASLLECALAGQADEWITAALDWLVTGQGDWEASLGGLLGWGANSGVDTLAGIGAAIVAQTIEGD